MSSVTQVLRASPSSWLLRNQSLRRGAPLANRRGPRSGSAATAQLRLRGKTPAASDCVGASLGSHDYADFVAISSDRRYAMSRVAGTSRDTKVWDITAKAVIWRECLGELKALAVAVAAAPLCIVLSTSDSLLVFNAYHRSPICNFPVDNISSVAITADGLFVAANTANSPDKLQVWDTEAKACLIILEGFQGLVQAVAVTPDRRHAMLGLAGMELQLWDLQSAQRLATLHGDPQCVRSVAVTSDARFAVTGDAEELKVWSLAAADQSAGCVASLKGPAGAVKAVAVANDDCLVVTITGDAGKSELQVWDIKGE